MNKLIVQIRGMHCKSCEMLIEQSVGKIEGIKYVKSDYNAGQVEVHYKHNRPSDAEMAKAVKDAGYEIGQKEKLPWFSTNDADYKDLLLSALFLFGLYEVANLLGLFNLNFNPDTSGTGVFVALLVGLVAGVSTCMALVGGLVLSLSARHAEIHPEASAAQKFRPHLYFNLGRIVGFGLLGGVIGFLGSAFSPSIRLMGMLTVGVGFVMIFLGLRLIAIFPALNGISLTLPSSFGRALGLHKDQREYSHKWAIISGALTFFLPCGFTQAMQLMAVGTGSAVSGAIIMMLFALGTAPGLLGIGGLTSIFTGRRARMFFMMVGLLVIILGGFNIKNGRVLIASAPSIVQTQPAPAVVDNGDYQEVRMVQSTFGYDPNSFTVKKGKPVKWIIDSRSQFSCATSLIMPMYGIRKNLTKGENVITFTPTQSGEIPFSCSMGMYAGVFTVTD